jgi:hypothetical protein
MQTALYTAFQAENPEKFNEDLIYIRQKEDVDSYFTDLFMTLNSIPGITYLGMERVGEDKASQYIEKVAVPIEESRLDLILARFKLEINGEKKEVTLKLFIPRLVDDFFFQLNGNRFYATLQIADKNWYTVRNGVYLKTLLMPLGIRYRPGVATAADGTEYEGKVFLIDFFKTKTNNLAAFKNFFFHFFVKFGFEGALEKLGVEDRIALIDPENPVTADEDVEVLEIHKGVMIAVCRESLKTDRAFRNIVVTLCDALSHAKRVQSVLTPDFWRRRILNSPTAKIEKADKTIASLERVLDERTKKNLRELQPEQKATSFDVVSYMVNNFDELSEIDGVDLYSRRVRLVEYLLFPLLLKWSDIAVRILNSRNVDMKRLETVFSNIRPMFLIKKLVTNELLRYSNATNPLNLFNVALRWSVRGPQSVGAGGGNVNARYRSVHESFIGNLSLNCASAGDPGCSGTFVPFCDSLQDMFFERKP